MSEGTAIPDGNRIDRAARLFYPVGIAKQGNRASEAFDECAQEVVAPTCLLELHAV
jgi:hypothetical protein